jgi:beta-glucanase (GH16 family)
LIGREEAGTADQAATRFVFGASVATLLASLAACNVPQVAEKLHIAENQCETPTVQPVVRVADSVQPITLQNGWTLIWSDEFGGNSLDRSRWAPEESCWGGGNDEQQCYTDREANLEVSDGFLRITSRRETWTACSLPEELRREDSEIQTRQFTSGKIRTRGIAEWKYGRFSARMKLPAGQGTWPAFWMMPAEDFYGAWPLSGEIDILEAVNLSARCEECGPVGLENRVQGALHFGAPWPDNRFLAQKTMLPDQRRPDQGFHEYTVEWGEGRIDWYVDGLHYFRLTSSDWHTASPKAAGNKFAPFDRPMYLILNLAVGGRLSTENNEGGIDLDAQPAELLVDWVRVYRCEPDQARSLACLSTE